MRLGATTLATVGLLILATLGAGAQEVADLSGPPAPGPIRLSLARLESGASIPAVPNVPTSPRRPSFGRRVLGGVAMGAVGMVLGAIVGAQVAPDCHCDDPGLEGAMYGGSVGLIGGAALGASVGW